MDSTLQPKNEASGRVHTAVLWKKLHQLAMDQPDPAGDFALDGDLVEEVIEHFLPQAESDTHVEYWLAHGQLAGELMAILAKKWSRNETLYRQVGILHDADYYRHPHYGESTELVHPAPLCFYLLERGVPAVVCLAILEHAGYTAEGTRFSMPMSAAISTCDDLATYMSALDSTEFVRSHGQHVATSKLSALAQEVIKEVTVPVPSFPGDFNCPKRVLGNIDLFINNSLTFAADEHLGWFKL
jgi:hypothetical protein